MQNLPSEGGLFAAKLAANPFEPLAVSVSAGLSSVWEWSFISHEEHRRAFVSLLGPADGVLAGGAPAPPEDDLDSKKIAGRRCHEFFIRSGLPNADLGRIWTLSDRDQDGLLDLVEFSVMMHLVKLALSGIQIPESVPGTLFPPSHD
jgi:hypothetical protein